MLKTIFRISLTVCFAFVAGMGNAQQTARPVTQPVLTFLQDNSGGLRPLIGIAGSASVGAPLDLGFGILQAAIPPDHDYVLATSNQSNWPLWLQVRDDTVTVRSIDPFSNHPDSGQAECEPDDADRPWGQRTSGCRRQTSQVDQAPRIDRIALSSTGSAAAFFSESQGRIYTVGNLSQSPTLLGEFGVGAGSVSAFGVSDDGQTLVVGVSDGSTGSLFLLNPNQAPRLIASMRHPSAIQFLHNSASAVIADDVDNKIYGLVDGQFFALATAKDGVSAPIAVAVSKDNQRTFVGSSDGAVTTLGPYGAVSKPMYCNCALTGLHSTNIDSVFRLTDFSGGTVSLFDGGSRLSRMILVPVSSHE